jgi:hypothetical protein
MGSRNLLMREISSHYEIIFWLAAICLLMNWFCFHFLAVSHHLSSGVIALSGEKNRRIRYINFLIVLLAATTVSLSGCASSTRGKDQRIIVTTPGAPGASCRLFSGGQELNSFTTPEAILLSRTSGPVEVRCQKKCFPSAVKIFAPSINGEQEINDISADLAFLSTNLMTQRAYNYNFDFIIPMKHDGRCKRREKAFLDGNPNDFNNTIDDFSFEPTMPPQTRQNAEFILNQDSMAPLPKEKSRP